MCKEKRKKKPKEHLLPRIMAAVCASALVLSGIPQGGIKTVNAEEKTDASVQDGNNLRLWYSSPANISTYDSWEKWSLPIGNSAIGASVFGGVDTERIQLNEKSLWSGGPSDSRLDYNGGNVEANGKNGAAVKKIQELFREGKNSEASNLCSRLTGVSDDAGVNGYGYYLSYGNMYLDFKNGATPGNVENYSRDLNIRNAVSSVDYDYKGTHYHRENFVSYPDNVLVTRLTAEGGTMDFDVRVEPDNKKGGGNNNPSQNSYSRTWNTTVSDGLLSINGELKDNQMKFSSQTKVVADKGGKVKDGSEKVSVSGAKEVTIYTSIGTDYKDDYPKYRTGQTAEEVAARVTEYVSKAADKGFDAVKDAHVKDYSSIFSRVDLNLGQTVSEKTTDKLLSAYKNGKASEGERRQLEVMLFQYGRYLTIESSRETPADDPGRATLPANLQGIWVGANNSAWHADYHMNVNLQMNYWPTYSTNMAECAQPLIAYVDGLRKPGRVTAKIYAGVGDGDTSKATGFMAHTQNNPFGWTCPGWNFDWGWSPAAVPWILQNCWDYYDFTGDTEYLRNVIYPMMKEEAIFYDQILVDDGNGKLVSSPSYSPEHGPKTAGNTYEQTLIWQLYHDTIQAAQILGVDAENVATWKSNQSNLKGPIEIGDSGQIKEWYEETTVNSMGEGFNHRHLSHMLGLFPGDLISSDTPEWFAAAKVSMNNRTDESTGWGMGQRINTWARLEDGNRAYKLITDLFQRGILTNMWDTHPPFQIDGNFGMTSGVAEMLLQSNQGYINLLPALPDAWSDGSVNGLVARGNFVVNMNWEKGAVKTAKILSNNGGTATVQFKNASYATVVDSAGNVVTTTPISEKKISFETAKGETYTIKDIPDMSVPSAPTGLEATRIHDDKTDLTWDAYEAEGKTVTYNIYRQIDGGDVQRIAADVTTPSYTDVEARDILGTISYQVSAVVDENEGKRCEMSTVKDLRNMVGMIDDKDPRIQYTGDWKDWDHHGDPNYGDTIKFLENPIGNETAKMDFVGTGIEVVVCTNRDRGYYEVFVDGKSEGKVDTYSETTKRQAVVFTKDDLKYGKHTIELKVLAEKNPASTKSKVELDAFRVLDTTIQKPESITVSAASGITVIGKANSHIQMKAVISPENASDKSVTWSVDNAGLASIDQNGLLTVGNKNGKIKVTAASQADSSITSETELTIAIAGDVADNKEIVEDSVDNRNPNPAITWTGAWNTYAGEADKHHGGTKTEARTGASFSYTFNGTGIEVYAQKHENFSSFDVKIDNAPIENASLEGSHDGDPQSLVFSKTGLENGTHTITCTLVDRNGKTGGNLDYLAVLTPGVGSNVDRTALQDKITDGTALIEKAYDAGKWAAFKQKYDAAVTVMNDMNADEAAVSAALQALTDAMANLGEPHLPPPTVGEAKGETAHVETTKATISWGAMENAASYLIQINGGALSRAAFSGSDNNAAGEGDITTTNTWYTLTDLKPGTAYEVSVYGVNEVGDKSADAIVIPIETVAATDADSPASVTDITKRAVGKDSVELAWKAPADKDLAGYYIYVGNVKAATIKDKAETKWLMKGLTVDQTYVVKIVAYDESGNSSIPTQFAFKFSEEKIIEAITVTPSELEVKKGTAFKDLKLPKTVDVTYKTGLNEKDVPVKWEKGDYTADTAGIYTIPGKLVTDIQMENPNKIEPSVKVTVKADSVSPDNPGPPNPDKPNPDKPNTDKPNPDKPNPDKPNPDKPNTDKPNTDKPNPNKPKPNKPNPGKPSGNTIKDNVKTGDENHPAIWVTVAILAVLAAGATTIAILLKRRRRS